jgi:hypothetical protein
MQTAKSKAKMTHGGFGKRSSMTMTMTWNPGDFIKPDPTLSVEETQEHILNELYRYFQDLKHPSDRLKRIQTSVSGTYLESNPALLGEIIFDILHAYLVDTRSCLQDLLPSTLSQEFIHEVLGFIEEDTLPDSTTVIASVWIPSPSSSPSSEDDVNILEQTIPVPLYVAVYGIAFAAAWLLGTHLCVWYIRSKS